MAKIKVCERFYKKFGEFLNIKSDPYLARSLRLEIAEHSPQEPIEINGKKVYPRVGYGEKGPIIVEIPPEMNGLLK